MRSRAAVVAVALIVSACSGPPVDRPSSDEPSASLTIYAASSLKTALEKVAPAYEAATGTMLTVSTDASSALTTKVELGANGDVFLSADVANPQRLVNDGLARGPVVQFARNRLAIIAPRANGAAVHSPADLARSGVKVIAAGESVPITRYAEQLVANLATQLGHPADYVARYAANVSSREDNVAAVVAKIELGEGDAAIVYATDARSATDVTIIPVPDASNVSATYGGVALAASANQAEAGAFLNWLSGADGQAILASLGFAP